MTTPTLPGPDEQVESLRVMIARGGFGIILLLLIVGVPAGLVREDIGRTLLTAAVAMLAIMPVTGVLALFVEEARRRDWPFAAAALLVLVLLGISLLAIRYG